jgi:uncharacterized protein
MLRGEAGPQVPCGDCVGCCISSYPVPVRAHEHTALAAVPTKHLATARAGHRMIMALPDGRCPMLGASGCSIYTHRPQTCRDYDCRIFAAAGIAAGDDDRSVINERVRNWRFSYHDSSGTSAHQAVKSAAVFIRDKSQCFPGKAPTTPTGIAVLAIKVYTVFLDAQPADRPTACVVQAIIAASREFDATTRR